MICQLRYGPDKLAKSPQTWFILFVADMSHGLTSVSSVPTRSVASTATRNQVITRDGNQCWLCEKTYVLEVAHQLPASGQRRVS